MRHARLLPPLAARRPDRARGGAAAGPPAGGRGFTLVELLVCLGVVGALIGALLPTLASAREAGRATVCASNLRQLHAGAMMYADDWQERLPPGFPDRLANLTRWHGRRPTTAAAFAPEGGTLTPYLGDGASAGVRECPTFAGALGALARAGLGFERSCGGYGYNNEYLGTDRRTGIGSACRAADDRSGSGRWLFRSPERTIAFADAAFASAEARGCGSGGVIEYTFVEPRFWPDFPAFRADPSIHFRHRGSSSIAWLDGHAAPSRMTFTWSSGLYGVEAAAVGIGWTGEADDNSLFDFE